MSIKDKWHPDSVKWPEKDDPVAPVECVPTEAYRALYEQREKELAAARELADAAAAISSIKGSDGLYYQVGSPMDKLNIALAAFKEVDK